MYICYILEKTNTKPVLENFTVQFFFCKDLIEHLLLGKHYAGSYSGSDHLELSQIKQINSMS